jgi:PPK2 family polyphosphate:nucleotide phosphotransferase
MFIMPLEHDRSRAFRIDPSHKVDLDKIDPKDTDRAGSSKAADTFLTVAIKEIDQLQDRLYAESQRSVLVILQGMDTSGKDGTVRSVFNATGPIGVTVKPFRKPCGDELEHDFLWRAHIAAPKKGTITIFNRSHYEDVLVGKVRKLTSHTAIDMRFAQINAFEKMLVENGTVIIKFMLHISKAEQGKRLQERLDHADKRWKFQASDLEDRHNWKDFMNAYEIMLARCSTPWAPWHVIPADHKWARNAAIAGIVRDTLAKMDPHYPQPTWKPSDFVID